MKALFNHISGIALREGLLSGVIDTLVFGTDEILTDKPCTSGIYTKVGNIVKLDKCVGIYEINAKAVAATGTIDLTNSYDFKNLLLQSPNGESQNFTGAIKFDDTVTTATIMTAEQIKLVAKELNASNKLIDVNYTLSNYRLVWTPQDAKNIKLQVSAKLASTGGETGDFNVAFDNSTTPFYFKVNSDDEIQGYPYAGTLSIVDLKANANTITITTINDQMAQYKAVVDNKTLIDQTKKWSELLGY